MLTDEKIKKIELSVVVPVFNEEEGIGIFNDLLSNALKKTNITYEIIYVNDGSTDNTSKILSMIANNQKEVRLVSFSRNFGKEMATTAGIDASKGSATILMDADGQHPPELISIFLDKWRKGAKIVIGIRNSNQKEGLVKKYGSKLFYRLFNSTSGTELIPRSTDFRLIDSIVKEEFVNFSEHHRITRGLIDWLGFERDYVTFDSPARLAGKASYKTSQLVKLALNSFVSLSLKPLFYFGWVGAFITIVSLLTGIFIFVEQLLLGDPLYLHFTGSAILGILMSFLVGLVLISQSIMATYMSHIHAQTQSRPLYVIDKSRSKRL